MVTFDLVLDAGIPVRAIDLVRDPRDIFTSILDFDERRGFFGFGRQPGQSDLDYVETGGGRPSTPWTESVPLIRTPTLLVTGDADVITGPASRAVVAEIANPAIEVVVIPGAGHYVRHQQGDAFHGVVDPWLRTALTAKD